MVAFQGEVGAYSEEAVRRLLPAAVPRACPSFEAVFEAVSTGAVTRGLVPIENSLFGSVHINYDLLMEHDLWIAGETQLRIRHHLMAKAGSTLPGIRRVYSHPQALGQCRAYLRAHLPQAEAIPAYDTAGAAQMVQQLPDPDVAAIASVQAAHEYGLTVLAAGIETNQQNYTRFLLLVQEPDTAVPGLASAEAGGSCKTSIVYTLQRNVPGGLFKSLAVFALREIDLFKIESRPLIGEPGQYRFYLDLDGAAHTEPVQRALTHLQELTDQFKLLGSYPAGS
ncbi:MAG: prephenate dehydratase [Bacteroidota bacterium]